MVVEREFFLLGDGKFIDFEDLEDGEDLFISIVFILELSLLFLELVSFFVEDISVNFNGLKFIEVVLDDDREDFFVEVIEEVFLDSFEREFILFLEFFFVVIFVIFIIFIVFRIELKSMFVFVIFDRFREEIEEEVNGDIFDIEIGVLDLEKVGDGMNVYMVYRVIIKIFFFMFSKSEFLVKRRFSDFFGLYSKLVSKYLYVGYIVLLVLEKSIVGMIKVKVGKEDLLFIEFVEKWRVVFERYF